MRAPESVLDRRRRQLGESILGSVAGDRAVARVGEGWWLVLSGAPSADGNTGLVFSPDARVLHEVVREIARSGHPTELMTAGDAPDLELAPRWRRTGTMPVMGVRLADTRLALDGRVRRATPADLGTVVQLLVDAYGLDAAVAAAVVVPVLDGGAPIRFWLLEDGGTAVSTVMTARCEEVVTVWCMATTPSRGRQGLGGALLAHVLAAASADGASEGLLGASPAGASLYRATGWAVLEHWRLHHEVPPDDGRS